jgi:hypothetical protein
MSVVRYGKLLSACLSIAGVALLFYVLGAGAMFYQLPPSGWLANAFAGARVWTERQAPARPVAPEKRTPEGKPSGRSPIDRPERTCDGFTLYTCISLQNVNSEALLINMQRELVHRWAIPFSRIWPNPAYLDMRPIDSRVCFFDSYLYPSGDLLVVFHTMDQGCGLAKLDKESRPVWADGARMHHAVDVAEDGTIYALKKLKVDELPGMDRITTPCWVDYLVALSPDGKDLSTPISIIEAIHNSPYAALLSTLETPVEPRPDRTGSTAPTVNYAYQDEDRLHANCVRVLRRDVAAKFPNFKAGHVLISLRTPSTLVMLDPATGAVDWAARGPWQAQHDPQFLDNGRLLMFDNLGSPVGSRVLEYDPRTQAFPWSFSGEGSSTFYSSERGMCQRLPNGNTFIVSSEDGEILEVTPEKEVVWSCALDGFITCARRYLPEQLPFLSADQRARP